VSQTIQFRCPECLKLLFKFNKATGIVEYHMSSHAFDGDEKGYTKYVACPKCKTECEITKTGLTRSNVVVGN
jgi:phage FluMu protein Com